VCLTDGIGVLFVDSHYRYRVMACQGGSGLSYLRCKLFQLVLIAEVRCIEES
jgi:hypothetical protein